MEIVGITNIILGVIILAAVLILQVVFIYLQLASFSECIKDGGLSVLSCPMYALSLLFCLIIPIIGGFLYFKISRNLLLAIFTLAAIYLLEQFLLPLDKQTVIFSTVHLNQLTPLKILSNLTNLTLH
jgi:hypothetical protein